MDPNETLEIGIFLLPNKEASSEIDLFSQTIVRDFHIPYDYKNIPHVSLFQMCVDKEKLSVIIQSVQEIAENNASLPLLFFQKQLVMKGNNLFLNLYESQALSRLNEKIIENISSLRSKKLMKQVVDTKTNPSMVEDINKYGIWWGLPHNYDPHFTIVYDLKKKLEITQLPLFASESFKPSALGVGLLGYNGNVNQILRAFLI